jgi:hypothetical protein
MYVFRKPVFGDGLHVVTTDAEVIGLLIRDVFLFAAFLN